MVTAPSCSEVVSAWQGTMHGDQLGGEWARPIECRKVSHLLLDSATEILLDELPAGGRLQLQVPLQSLEWQVRASTQASLCLPMRPGSIRRDWKYWGPKTTERSAAEDPEAEDQMAGNLLMPACRDPGP